MSIAAIRWAWGHKCLGGTETLVLVALADHANDHGVCWPSNKTLQDKTRLSERAIRRAVRTLEGAGFLSTVLHDGMSLRYRLSVGRSDTPATVAGGPDTPGCETSTPATVAAPPANLAAPPATVAPKPSITPTEPPKDLGASRAVAAAAAPPGRTLPLLSVVAGTATVGQVPLAPSPQPAPAASPRKRAASEKLGHRLPPDWEPDEKLVLWTEAWAKQHGVALDVVEVLERFRDYWLDRPDSKARRLQWVGTWKSWIRRDVERLGQAAAAERRREERTASFKQAGGGYGR